MTRKEQIFKVCSKYISVQPHRGECSDILNATAEKAFIAGAEWADANPCMPSKVVNIPDIPREKIIEQLVNHKATLIAVEPISPWISVEERLPEMRSNNNPFSERVYVRYVQTVSGKESIFYAFDELQYICLSSGKIIGHEWCRHQNKYDRVTHWMPIPQLPKKEGV